MELGKEILDKELHLIVLWQNARYKQEEIIKDISENLDILECIDIKWSENKVANNFTRFYGVKLDSGSGKEQECGCGNFLLVTAYDKTPKYDFVETSRGFEWVNINLFNLKEKYRSWTKGGHKIHTTNSPEETNHDLSLLLGVNYDDYIKSAPQKWNGEIRIIEKDLEGSNGWKSLEHLFYILNATSNYVVLRGLEDIDTKKDNKISDIDIFCSSYENLCYIVNGEPKINEIRPHFYTKIGEKFVYLDIWDINKNYYDKNWSDEILSSRILKDGIYRPDDENAFYEFIYHCFMHKRKMKSEYDKIAKNLYEKLPQLDEKYKNIQKFDDYFYMLKDFMNKKGYTFVKPNDKTVYFNEDLLYPKRRINWLENNYFLKNAELFEISEKSGAGCQYFKGDTSENEEVFIKWGGFDGLCKNEFKMAQKMYKNNSKNFLKPYFYKDDGDLKNIVFEFVHGETLEDLINNNKLSDDQKKFLITELENIAKSLKEEKIVHRDIIPRNFILSNDGHLKLTDFQFAVSFDSYIEPLFIMKNPLFIGRLGEDFAFGKYIWDDFYSVSKIIKLLGGKSDFVENNIGKFVIKFAGLSDKIEYKNLFEKIFSVKNERTINTKRKILTILGIKIKFKKRYRNEKELIF